MSNQAQIDAVEHLLMAVLRRSKISLLAENAFEDALASIMESTGPGGTREKTEAADYLKHLRASLG
ncbi:hypothetical protein [Pseudomonas citronellolis]|uniref:hypothetical protein n=1 Tax=Pseudomonas citronellolis TaxID=53408 RepID=UPI000718598F|nr:hypothetical protein [Pseudomonas citronellolis]KRV64201.1 hypothetical protein AO742_26520 [Pseudomonas citronellolis]KRW77497.1 hypothetical protein AO738_04495 [Pseudomonas citronellolis]